MERKRKIGSRLVWDGGTCRFEFHVLWDGQDFVGYCEDEEEIPSIVTSVGMDLIKYRDFTEAEFVEGVCYG